jgi:ankyrin repeat protein
MAQAALEEHFGFLNAQYGEGHYTPLMSSSLECLLDVVERLVGLGADLNMTNAYGHTAVFYSVIQGHYETMHFLLKAGATSEGVDQRPNPMGLQD